MDVMLRYADKCIVNNNESVHRKSQLATKIKGGAGRISGEFFLMNFELLTFLCR